MRLTLLEAGLAVDEEGIVWNRPRHSALWLRGYEAGLADAGSYLFLRPALAQGREPLPLHAFRAIRLALGERSLT